MREAEWQRRCLLAQARVDQMQALLKDGVKLMDDCSKLILEMAKAIGDHRDSHAKSKVTGEDRALWEILKGIDEAGWLNGKGVGRKK